MSSWRRALGASLVAVAAILMALVPAGAEEEPWLRVTFLDFRHGDGTMGHGDVALYEAWCGERGVVDISDGAGGELLALLDARGDRRLSWIAASHYHGDHIGAIADVAVAPGVTVETAYDRGGTPDDPSLPNDITPAFGGEYYPWVSSGEVVRRPVDIGDRFALCGGTVSPVTFDVLSAGTDGTAAGGVAVAQENDKSLCLKVTLRQFDLATCGDINGSDGRDDADGDDQRRDVETAVGQAFGDVEFVHVNHHGHHHSSNASFVSTLDPEAVVVSSGRAIDDEVLARWSAVAAVYQTGGDPASVDGNVVVETSGVRDFSVRGEHSGRIATFLLDQESGSPSSTTSSTTVPPTTKTTRPRSESSRREGYRMLSASGAVYAFGDGGWFGNATVEAVDIEAAPSGNGYWIVGRDASIHAFGDARPFEPFAARLDEGEHAVAFASTPMGDGGWLFTTSGRVLVRGTAQHFGHLVGVPLNGPILDAVSTPTGAGYYLIGSDGGVFAFGDAAFRGSMGATRLNAPVVSVVPDQDGVGYWLVAADGGVFAFDASFRGSMGNQPLNQPVVGMVPYGLGYLMVAADGGVFTFSTGPFMGSLGDQPPPAPIVAIAAVAH